MQVVLAFCLFAVAVAFPQGYDYSSPQSSITAANIVGPIQSYDGGAHSSSSISHTGGLSGLAATGLGSGSGIGGAIISGSGSGIGGAIISGGGSGIGGAIISNAGSGHGGAIISSGGSGHGGAIISGSASGQGGAIISGSASGQGAAIVPGSSVNANHAEIGLNALKNIAVSGNSLSGGPIIHQQQHHAPIISKQFFLHSAPEETAEEAHEETISLGPSRKHYRIVFIKAPYQTSKAAAISIAQAQNEEKTIIYVLSKKVDASDIQAHIKNAPQIINKPEVYFIKYKTPEEAIHAQKTIQAQYDSLGGSSHISDEGISPITSVIGSLGSHTVASSNLATHITADTNAIAKNEYLPPN